MPWLIPAIGAGVGVLKNAAIDKPAADRAADLRAAEQRYEPYTGVQAHTELKHTDPWGAAFGGAGSAQALASGLDLDAQRKALVDSEIAKNAAITSNKATGPIQPMSQRYSSTNADLRMPSSGWFPNNFAGDPLHMGRDSG